MGNDSVNGKPRRTAVGGRARVPPIRTKDRNRAEITAALPPAPPHGPALPHRTR